MAIMQDDNASLDGEEVSASPRWMPPFERRTGARKAIRAELNDAPASATGVLVVDLGAIRRNYAKLSALAANAETAAVVKADGYGLGADRVAAALAQSGCRTFFVATLAEGQQLRASCPNEIIYVLDGLLPNTAPMFADAHLRPVLGSLAEIAEWTAFCKSRGETLLAAIHVDTGMTRLGLSVKEAHASIDELEGHGSAFDHTLLITHFACADNAANPMNAAQLERFREIALRLPHVKTSLANSGGIYLGADYHGDLVRPGIALYGGQAQTRDPNPMAPVVSLYGRIAQVQWVEAGQTVGYGATATLSRRSRIATVSVGYADGLFRALSSSDARSGASGFICEQRLPLLGRVSMDLIMFDVTDVPELNAARGGWIELLGHSQTIDDLAAIAGTIGYEVLTSLGRRYHRVYIDE